MPTATPLSRNALTLLPSAFLSSPVLTRTTPFIARRTTLDPAAAALRLPSRWIFLAALSSAA